MEGCTKLGGMNGDFYIVIGNLLSMKISVCGRIVYYFVSKCAMTQVPRLGNLVCITRTIYPS